MHVTGVRHYRHIENDILLRLYTAEQFSKIVLVTRMWLAAKKHPTHAEALQLRLSISARCSSG